MAVQKPQGSQIDIQSVAADISVDATAIGSIASGVTTDPGAIATVDANYVRRDGTNTMDGVLTMNGGAVVGDPSANPTFVAYAFDPLLNDGFSRPAAGQLDIRLGNTITFTIDAANNIGPNPEVKSHLPLRMSSAGAAAERDIMGVNDIGLATINGNVNIDVTDIGVNVEAYDPGIQAHIADASLHFTEASIDHTAIQNIGVNSHAMIDSHIADASLHFTEASIDHANIVGVGTNSHAAIDGHIADATIHFTEASIDHANIVGVGVYTHAQIDTHIGDSTVHFTEGSIDHANIINVGTNSHAQIDAHISDMTVHFVINDSGTAVNEVYSASKISTDLAGKADLIGTPVLGNLVSMDGSGNIADSGASLATFATAAQGALADSALQAEVNDLSAAVVWANIPDANVPASAVTQHQAALSITESQISDLQAYSLTGHTHVKADITDFSDGDYAAASHPHVKADITDFSDGDYAAAVHTHVKADITDFAHTHTKADITDFSDGDYATAAQGATADSAVQPGAATFTAPVVFPAYTLGTLPVGVVGGVIYVSDANTSVGAIAFYNGTSWIDIGTGITVA